MALTPLNSFCGGTNYVLYPDRNSERTINFYLEASINAAQVENAKTQYSLVGTPGLNRYMSPFSSTWGTGVYACATATFTVGTAGERVFFVSGYGPTSGSPNCHLMETTGQNVLIDKGLMPNGYFANFRPWKIVPGTNQMLIIGGGGGCIFTSGAETINSVLTGFPGADDATYQDGYFAVIAPGSQRFYISAYQDGTQWDALDYALENDLPDTLVAIRSFRRELWVFGMTRLEIWSNTGAANFPFQRNSSVSIRVGCASAACVQIVGDSIMWLSRDQTGSSGIYRAVGYAAQRVSTPAIDKILAFAVETEGFGINFTSLAFRWNGHEFYAISLPLANVTLLYDVTTGFWFEWSLGINIDTGLFPMHQASCATYSKALGQVLVGTRTENSLMSMQNQADDYGNAIWRIRATPEQPGYGARRFYSRFLIDGTPNSKYRLQWNDAYSAVPIGTGQENGFTAPLGNNPGTGVPGNRIEWRRLGSSYNGRMWQILVQDDAVSPTVMNAAFVDQT